MFHDKLKKTQEGNLILELHNAPWKDGWMFTVTRTSKGFKKRSFLSCVTICPSFSRPSVPRQQIRCTSRSCFADDFQQTTFPSTRLKCESHESDTVFFLLTVIYYFCPQWCWFRFYVGSTNNNAPSASVELFQRSLFHRSKWLTTHFIPQSNSPEASLCDKCLAERRIYRMRFVTPAQTQLPNSSPKSSISPFYQ